MHHSTKQLKVGNFEAGVEKKNNKIKAERKEKGL